MQVTAASLHTHLEPTRKYSYTTSMSFLLRLSLSPPSKNRINRLTYSQLLDVASNFISTQVYATWKINVHDYAFFFSELQGTKLTTHRLIIIPNLHYYYLKPLFSSGMPSQTLKVCWVKPRMALSQQSQFQPFGGLPPRHPRPSRSRRVTLNHKWTVQVVIRAGRVAAGASNATSSACPAANAKRPAWNVSTKDPSDGSRVSPSAARCKVDHTRMQMRPGRLKVQCLRLRLHRPNRNAL